MKRRQPNLIIVDETLVLTVIMVTWLVLVHDYYIQSHGTNLNLSTTYPSNGRTWNI